MLDLTSLAIDSKKATEGVWVKMGQAEFLLARHNNPNASVARSEAIAKFYSEIQDVESIDEKTTRKFRKVNIQVFCEHVLLGWKNVGLPNAEGVLEAVDYTPERGVEILSNDDYYELHQFLLEKSIEQENYRIKNEEAVVEDVKPSANS